MRRASVKETAFYIQREIHPLLEYAYNSSVAVLRSLQHKGTCDAIEKSVIEITHLCFGSYIECCDLLNEFHMYRRGREEKRRSKKKVTGRNR